MPLCRLTAPTPSPSCGPPHSRWGSTAPWCCPCSSCLSCESGGRAAGCVRAWQGRAAVWRRPAQPPGTGRRGGRHVHAVPAAADATPSPPARPLRSTSIETVGDVSATEEASFISTTGPSHERRIRGALFNDSISSIFSALATSVPLTTFAQVGGGAVGWAWGCGGSTQCRAWWRAVTRALQLVPRSRPPPPPPPSPPPPPHPLPNPAEQRRDCADCRGLTLCGLGLRHLALPLRHLWQIRGCARGGRGAGRPLLRTLSERRMAAAPVNLPRLPPPAL